MDLLTVVGDDPNLKYIVLERFHDASDFYEDLSIRPLESAINKFKSPYAMNNTLCQSSEWAYVISNFMPEIRKINEKRPKDNPLLVTSVDGLSANNDILWPANPTAQGFDIDHYFKAMNYKTEGVCEKPFVIEAYALQTVFLDKNGNLEEKKTADEKWKEAISWSIDKGVEGLTAGVECVAIATGQSRHPMKKKSNG